MKRALFGERWRGVGGKGREVIKKSLRANQRNTYCVQHFREKQIELFKYKHTMD